MKISEIFGSNNFEKTEFFGERWNYLREHFGNIFSNNKRLNRNGMFYSIPKIMVILCFVIRLQQELVFG